MHLLGVGFELRSARGSVPLHEVMRFSFQVSVVGLLQLFECLACEATVQSLLLRPVTRSGDDPLDIRDRAVRPGLKDRSTNAFGLEQPDHSRHEFVCVGIGDAANGGADAL